MNREFRESLVGLKGKHIYKNKHFIIDVDKNNYLYHSVVGLNEQELHEWFKDEYSPEKQKHLYDGAMLYPKYTIKFSIGENYYTINNI